MSVFHRVNTTFLSADPLHMVYYSIYNLRPGPTDMGKVVSHAVYKYELRPRYSLCSILAALNRYQRVIGPVDDQCGH